MELRLVIFAISIQSFFNTLPVSGKWPDDLRTQFDFPTPTPISLNSSQARPLTGLSPLTFIAISTDKLNITNNGRTIVASLAQPKTKATLTGGVLKEIYVFNQIFVTLSNSHRGRSGTIIDDGKTPLEVVHIYVKKSYSTIEEAKNHRDGIVAVVKRIKVSGVIPNKDFPPFAKILAKLKKPGSFVIAPVPAVFLWYDKLQNYTSYFMHPGSYNDPYNGYGYECAIITLFAPTLFPSITLSEFKSFLDLRANDNLPMSNSLPNFEMGQIPVIQATGVVVDFHS